MLLNKSLHLSREEQIQLGSYYTPEKLVNIICNFISPYIKKNPKRVIFDNAAGCGAFIYYMRDYDYRASDCDNNAFDFLKKILSEDKIFYGNSLKNVNRKKYNIPDNAFLIQIGNPPYNDTTSEFRNGEKGRNNCDDDLYDRDLGISFLKSYYKLDADVISVLHPLSYLIKKTNFKRLKEFKDNYVLKKCIIFSSSWFDSTGTIKFPIIASLYEKSQKGMDFNYIKNFEFSILGTERKFRLSSFRTTDGYIRKYPPRKRDNPISPIGLYYYTFRDLNSLRKNTTFLNKEHYNGIVVTIENFYKYSYLYCLKHLFHPPDIWLYGNLSPLVNIGKIEHNKNIYIEYAFQDCTILQNLNRNIKEKIFKYYKINPNKLSDIEALKKKIQEEFKALI